MRYDVEQAIEKFEIFTFGNRKHIEKAEAMLNNNENVLFVTPVSLTVLTINTGEKIEFSGTAFLTDKRVLFCNEDFIRQISEILPLDEIRSVDSFGNGIIPGVIEIHSLVKTYKLYGITRKKHIIRKIHEEFETAVNNYKSQQAAFNSTPQPNSPQPDIADQIKKLAQLRDEGILTEEEFQAKKTDLLSRM